MRHFCEVLNTWSLRINSVTRQVTFNRTKIGEKCQSWTIEMRHFGWFSNTVECTYSTRVGKARLITFMTLYFLTKNLFFYTKVTLVSWASNIVWFVWPLMPLLLPLRGFIRKWPSCVVTCVVATVVVVLLAGFLQHLHQHSPKVSIQARRNLSPRA